MEHWHTSWLSCTLEVVSATDPSLVGRSGIVVSESRNTVTVEEHDGMSIFAKNTIQFTINNSEPVVGSMVCQRPEDRVQRKDRRT